MEEVKKEVQKYKTIKSGVDTVIQYKACDGKLFNKKKDAEDHEEMLERQAKWEAIKRIEFELSLTEADVWYFMDSQETIDFFMQRMVDTHYDYLNGYHFGDKNALRVGDWVSYHTEYGDCSHDTTNFYTLAHLKTQVDALMERADASRL